jgi:cytochrome b
MTKRIVIWDLPIRLFHWSLAVLFACMWFTGKQGGDWLRIHVLCGEVVIVLLLFRVIWGIFGSQTARFAEFVRGPAAVRRYLRGENSPPLQPGHNPLGGWMVVTLLTVLSFQGLTGLFASDEDSYFLNGPLAHCISDGWSSRLTEVHKTVFNVILGLVALHICAIVAYRLFRKQDLLGPMLSGCKDVDETAPSPVFAPMAWALAGILFSAAVVAALVWGLS